MAAATPMRAAISVRSAGDSCPKRWSRRLRRSKPSICRARADESFARELSRLLTHYVGPADAALGRAPSARTRAAARGFCSSARTSTHTGAHKINNALGQALLAVRMGKKRIVAETGAGQHGVASATAARCSASSASSTWAPKTWRARR